jgi:chromosome segregation ATPase
MIIIIIIAITIFVVIIIKQALQQQKAVLEEEIKCHRSELESLQAAVSVASQETALLASSQQELIGKLSDTRKELEVLRAAEISISNDIAAATEEHDALAVKEVKLQVSCVLSVLRAVLFNQNHVNNSLIQNKLDAVRNEIEGCRQSPSPLHHSQYSHNASLVPGDYYWRRK